LRRLTQIEMAKESEFQVDDVITGRACEACKRLGKLRHHDAEAFETARREQRAQLEEALFEAAAAEGVSDQHHLAAIGFHCRPALRDVEFVIDQCESAHLMAPGNFAHQAMGAGLGTETWRARRHLGNEEDAKPPPLSPPQLIGKVNVRLLRKASHVAFVHTTINPIQSSRADNRT